MKVSELLEEHPLDVDIAKQTAIEYTQTNRPKIWDEGNPWGPGPAPDYENPDEFEVEYYAHRVFMDQHVGAVYREIGKNNFLVQVNGWFADPHDKKDGMDWSMWIYIDIDKDEAKEINDPQSRYLGHHFLPDLFDGSDEDNEEIAKKHGGWVQVE